MRMSVLGHHGSFWALCQFSATWFSFGFISKTDIKSNEKKTKWMKKKLSEKLESEINRNKKLYASSQSPYMLTSFT